LLSQHFRWLTSQCLPKLIQSANTSCTSNPSIIRTSSPRSSFSKKSKSSNPKSTSQGPETQRNNGDTHLRQPRQDSHQAHQPRPRIPQNRALKDADNGGLLPNLLLSHNPIRKRHALLPGLGRRAPPHRHRRPAWHRSQKSKRSWPLPLRVHIQLAHGPCPCIPSTSRPWHRAILVR
jgi:hypothetical protein